MNRDFQEAVDLLVQHDTTAESHPVEVQTSAFIAGLEQAQPRTQEVQEAIETFDVDGHAQSVLAAACAHSLPSKRTVRGGGHA